MIKRASIIVFILTMCTGCYAGLIWYSAIFDPASMQGPQTFGWAHHIHRQCNASTSEISREDCRRLVDCMREVGISIFEPPSSAYEDRLNITRIYNRIVPRVDYTVDPEPPYSMSFLRERAEKAGPRAVALFTEMEDARNVCLAETGLTERIGYN